MTEVSAPELKTRVSSLRDEHQQLERQLSRLQRNRQMDDESVSLLKKQKLVLKDSIQEIERTLQS